MLTDTHCHLDMIEDPKIALLRAKEVGVTTIINVGTSVDASRQSIEIAESTDLVDVYATCGIHAQEGPKDIKKYGADFMTELKKVAQSSKKVVGIGECGMDYFLEATDKGPATSDDNKKAQRELFEVQVRLAVDLNLPLVIHCRNAWEETFESISKFQTPNSKIRGLFHSWTGSLDQAKKALDLGFYISFSGILTFKNAGEIPEVAKMVPEDRLLVETDAPFLTPRRVSITQRFSGANETNEPKNVRITAQFLADLRHLPFDRISDITGDNAKKLFGV